ncbi:MAG: lipase family protein [Pseudanabaenaceae cyanobacterium bins.39]|nr:lipase family protein [Pseudanabaenaceae cyanobacterium bins.39]
MTNSPDFRSLDNIALAEYYKPEFLTSGAYSPKDALAFAAVCQLSYAKDLSQPAIQKELLPKWGWKRLITFDKRLGHTIDTQGLVAEHDQHIVIAFRGSESLPDWLTNASVAKVPSPFGVGEVHQGFQNALFPALTKILTAIRMIDPRFEKDIWVTGHSLGGALAVMFVAMLAEEDIDVRGLYTFGAPRVGDEDFAKIFNQKFIDIQPNTTNQDKPGISYRMVNQGDLVPHLPPELSGFYHTNNRILFTDSGDRTDSSTTWENFKSLIGSWLEHVGKPDLAIKDYHLLSSPNGYLHKLFKDLSV